MVGREKSKRSDYSRPGATLLVADNLPANADYCFFSMQSIELCLKSMG